MESMLIFIMLCGEPQAVIEYVPSTEIVDLFAHGDVYEDQEVNMYLQMRMREDEVGVFIIDSERGKCI